MFVSSMVTFSASPINIMFSTIVAIDKTRQQFIAASHISTNRFVENLLGFLIHRLLSGWMNHLCGFFLLLFICFHVLALILKTNFFMPLIELLMAIFFLHLLFMLLCVLADPVCFPFSITLFITTTGITPILIVRFPMLIAMVLL